MSLKKVQQYLAESIYDDHSDNIRKEIAGRGIAKDERLQIHKDNVLITICNTLKLHYPAICSLVDKRFFEYAAGEYIKDNKSKSGNLEDYGEGFADFLMRFSPTQKFDYLPDVARLEWALHRAYFAADAGRVTPEEFAIIPEEEFDDLKVSLHPSVSIISSKYPIDKIWEISQSGYEGSYDIDVNERGADVLVFRPEYKTQMCLLEEGEAVFLRELRRGFSLSQSYASAASKNKKFDVGVAIYKFCSNGVICKLLGS